MKFRNDFYERIKAILRQNLGEHLVLRPLCLRGVLLSNTSIL